jgi:hypothetical protein
VKNHNPLKLNENLQNFYLDTINILYYVITYFKFVRGGFFDTEKGCPDDIH